MKPVKIFQSRRSQRIVLLACALATALLLFLSVHNTTAPVIDLEYADTSIRIAADRSWTFFPGDCVNLSWEMEGIQSLYINEYGRIGRDKMVFCPAVNATSPVIEVTAQNGIYRRLELEIQHLPELLLYSFAFVALLGSGLLSLYFLKRYKLDRPMPINSFMIVLLLLLALGGAIHLTPVRQPLVDEDNGKVAVRFWAERDRIIFPHECLGVGWSVSGAQSLTFDGRDVSNAGNPGRARHCAGDGLAATLDIATTVAFYGILRLLRVAPLFAFLVAILFMVYPVNPMLLSLRSMLNNCSRLAFFLAIFYMLDFKRNPRRLTLACCWLALLYNVGNYETGYPLIFAAPLLWWLTRPNSFRRNVILTGMWYLIPLFKGAYMLLLFLTERDFYQSGLLRGGSQTQRTIQEVFAGVLEATRNVLSYTFVEGWQEALKSIEADLWWGSILMLLVLAGGVAWYLVRQSDTSRRSAARDIGGSVLIGFLLIPVSAVALLWLPLYAGDLWRPYIYVPLGASIALFGILLAVTSPVRNLKHRDLAVTALCLVILVPAASRLQLQGRGFVESADRKARILHRVLEIAPSVDATTQLLIVTPMENEALKRLGVFEFIHWDMINSAFYVLYGDGAPERAYFCLSWRICSTRYGEETIFNSDTAGELLQRTLVFKFAEDLALELVEDPVAELALDIDVAYDPSLLFDPDAPLPPRAGTMLGPALHR